MRRFMGVVMVLALLAASVMPAAAQQKMTLDKISETGTLTIGTRTGSPPFGYVNARNEWVGFSIDLVEELIKPAIEKKIGKPVKVEKKESAPPTRIPLLSSGAVDLIAETMTEVHGMLAKEVSADELKLAKESISRSLPALFETTQSTVGTIGGLFMYELPADYYEQLPARLDALTAAEVFEATKKHLTPDHMIVVAVGDRKTIEPQIARLKLGMIGYRTPDGMVAEAVAAR